METVTAYRDDAGGLHDTPKACLKENRAISTRNVLQETFPKHLKRGSIYYDYRLSRFVEDMITRGLVVIHESDL